ncbi:hypothetical protein H6F88_03110 [Oculatella sp. FACHB-28]|uniref:hypothetical protein n=1 Tax=Oculatella sp. FACHB-28 TaxID=2692845 RepID=UPI001682A138|nr:hypothetical protein [Oculatella sp. FACHB-28]MBD2055018.1 hypothetical protein [Oculatella sp. FACHB-28]
MLKFLRPALILSAVLLPLLGDSHTPTLAQERQGCFMVNDVGRLVDLSDICPSAAPVQIAEQQTLGTGDIQVTLRWTSTDDLDMAVTDPAGQTVTYFNPSVASGGQLDVDANAGCGETVSSPIENIFWPPSQAPEGDYTIEVNLYTRCGTTSGPISYTLTLLVQGNTETITGTVDDRNPIATHPFSLPQ